MSEEGLSRPSWYDVVSLYILIIIARNSENLQNRLVIVGIFEFPEFPGFLAKLVSERLRGISPDSILFRFTHCRIPEGVGDIRQTGSLAKSS